MTIFPVQLFQLFYYITILIYFTQNERQKLNIPEAINILKERNKNGNRYIWLTDEAIPPIILNKLLIKFTENQFNFIWHFRTQMCIRDRFHISESRWLAERRK